MSLDFVSQLKDTLPPLVVNADWNVVRATGESGNAALQQTLHIQQVDEQSGTETLATVANPPNGMFQNCVFTGETVKRGHYVDFYLDIAGNYFNANSTYSSITNMIAVAHRPSSTTRKLVPIVIGGTTTLWMFEIQATNGSMFLRPHANYSNVYEVSGGASSLALIPNAAWDGLAVSTPERLHLQWLL